MKNLFRFVFLIVFASYALAQVPAPQIPLTGSIGPGGIFPILNSGTLIFPSDADYTMTYPEVSANFLKVTSAVTLTATRNLRAPVGIGFQFTVENATTGGQAIQVIGATGAGVVIANGSTATVTSDGTNYVTSTGTGSGFTTGNDLSGTSTAQNVVGIQNHPIAAPSAAGYVHWNGSGWDYLNPAGAGTVTTVGWTGGIVSVANPTTAPAFTIAGTSGAHPYFNSATTWASTGAGTAHGVWLAQGAGNSDTTTGAGIAGQALLSGGTSSDPSYGTLQIGGGGTGATTAVGALANLGALPLAGGTMTGPMYLFEDPLTNTEAATKHYVDTSIPTHLSNSVTFSSTDSGAASGTSFNGSTAPTVGRNTLGLQPFAALPLGASLDGTAQNLEAVGSQSLLYGLCPSGDSIDMNPGTGAWNGLGWIGYIAADTGASICNHGAGLSNGGGSAADYTYILFYSQSPGDSSVPMYTLSAGSHDAECTVDAATGITDADCHLSSGVPTNSPAGSNPFVGFNQYVAAGATRMATSNTNVVFANSNTLTITLIANPTAGDTCNVNGTAC